MMKIIRKLSLVINIQRIFNQIGSSNLQSFKSTLLQLTVLDHIEHDKSFYTLSGMASEAQYFLQSLLSNNSPSLDCFTHVFPSFHKRALM